MFTPVRCISCGMPVGELAPFLRAAMKARAAEVLGEAGVDTLSAWIAANLHNEADDLLLSLGVVPGIYGDCCRTALINTVHFLDHY